MPLLRVRAGNGRAKDDLQPVSNEQAVALKNHEEGVTASQDRKKTTDGIRCQCESSVCRDHEEAGCFNTATRDVSTIYGSYKMCRLCAEALPSDFKKATDFGLGPMHKMEGNTVYKRYALVKLPSGRYYVKSPTLQLQTGFTNEAEAKKWVDEHSKRASDASKSTKALETEAAQLRNQIRYDNDPELKERLDEVMKQLKDVGQGSNPGKATARDIQGFEIRQKLGISESDWNKLSKEERQTKAREASRASDEVLPVGIVAVKPSRPVPMPTEMDGKQRYASAADASYPDYYVLVNKEMVGPFPTKEKADAHARKIRVQSTIGSGRYVDVKVIAKAADARGARRATDAVGVWKRSSDPDKDEDYVVNKRVVGSIVTDDSEIEADAGSKRKTFSNKNAAKAWVESNASTPVRDSRRSADAEFKKDKKCEACNRPVESTQKGAWKDYCKACTNYQKENMRITKDSRYASATDAKAVLPLQTHGSEPIDHMTRAASYEIQGDRARALDSYRAAATGYRKVNDSKNEAKARDGIQACQSAFDAHYEHPSAGRVKVCDSAESAVRTAIERTRAGEQVSVQGKTVRPGRASDSKSQKIRV